MDFLLIFKQDEQYTEECEALEERLKALIWVEWATVSYTKSNNKFNVNVVIDLDGMTINKLNESVEKCKSICNNQLRNHKFIFEWEKLSTAQINSKKL